jgi:hypothetical protein
VCGEGGGAAVAGGAAAGLDCALVVSDFGAGTGETIATAADASRSRCDTVAFCAAPAAPEPGAGSRGLYAGRLSRPPITSPQQVTASTLFQNREIGRFERGELGIALLSPSGHLIPCGSGAFRLPTVSELRPPSTLSTECTG